MLNRSIIFLTALAVMISATNLVAEEIEYPVAAYSKGELEKVRAWEKTWVGKKNYPVTDAEQVKEFLPQSLYDLMKDVDRWGRKQF